MRAVHCRVAAALPRSPDVVHTWGCVPMAGFRTRGRPTTPSLPGTFGGSQCL
ncbi:hypothetical protein BQ8420_14145 [Nocardiopsis sp. JB363]|nr:hypothetical protein BQ8420_14145 [Nocardiopsis sp. JB363]